jgi:N-acetylglucosamine kinase-like BadF-type ATPase
MHEKIVLGVDGGGTSTRAVLTSIDGTVLGLGLAGPSNYDDIGKEKTRSNIQLAVKQAWQQSGLAPRMADAAFLGMAGVVSDVDRAVIADMAASLELASLDFVGIDHDIRIALAGGLALEPGIVLIAGTGSSCYGRNAAGLSCRVGGWGYLLDDGGSSYYLGLEAMRAVVRSEDDRLGATGLTDRLLAALGLQETQDLMHRLYFPQMSRAEIATLAPMVLETAQQGDPIARQIVQDGQNELAGLVEVAARRLNFSPSTLAVTTVGGLAQSGSYFKHGLYGAIRSRVPGVQIQEPVLSPLLGAALLAIQLLGPLPSDAISNFVQFDRKQA